MARFFITGSTDGLGRAAAQSPLADGHEVVLHARSAKRLKGVADLAADASGIVIEDLESAAHKRSIAEQINAIFTLARYNDIRLTQ
jgi:short-subunit dehydrogenase